MKAKQKLKFALALVAEAKAEIAAAAKAKPRKIVKRVKAARKKRPNSRKQTRARR